MRCKQERSGSLLHSPGFTWARAAEDRMTTVSLELRCSPTRIHVWIPEHSQTGVNRKSKKHCCTHSKINTSKIFALRRKWKSSKCILQHNLFPNLHVHAFNGKKRERKISWTMILMDGEYVCLESFTSSCVAFNPGCSYSWKGMLAKLYSSWYFH